jgi:hypothetical protein
MQGLTKLMSKESEHEDKENNKYKEEWDFKL